MVRGVPKRSYCHPNFQRERRDLLKTIVRIPIKSKMIKVKKGGFRSFVGTERPCQGLEEIKMPITSILPSQFPSNYLASNVHNNNTQGLFYAPYVFTPYGPYSMMYPFFNCYPSMVPPSSNSYLANTPTLIPVSRDKLISNDMHLQTDLVSLSSDSIHSLSSNYSLEKDELDTLATLFESEEPF